MGRPASNVASVVCAIAFKDLRILLRDRAGAFFTFGFPLLFALFFGYVFRGGGDPQPVTIAVVDLSGGPMAKSFIEDLDADESLDARRVVDRAEGERLVRRGEVIACVVLPKDMESSAQRMFAGGGISVEAIVDPTRRAEQGLLTGKLNELAFRQMTRSFGDPAMTASMMTQARLALALALTMDAKDRKLLGDVIDSVDRLSKEGSPDVRGGPPGAGAGGGGGGFMPARVTISEVGSDPLAGPDNRPPNAWAISFPQGVAWGLMSCVVAFGSGLAQERTRGTLVRLAVAPVSRRLVLVGKAFGCFLACLLVVLFLMLFGRLVLGVAIGSPWLFLMAAVASAFGFSGIMMLLAGVFRTEGAAEGAGRAVVLVLAMIGGGTIPLVFMPSIMRTVSGVSPFKWTILAIEGAVWRGFTLADMALPTLVLVGFGTIGFGLGSWFFRRAEAR